VAASAAAETKAAKEKAAENKSSEATPLVKLFFLILMLKVTWPLSDLHFHVF